MAAKTPIDRQLETKHLFIAHLAGRLEAMESGAEPMNAVAYRLVARRLRSAMAGYPEPLLAQRLAPAHPSVADAISDRYFENHGRLPVADSRQIRSAAGDLLRRIHAER